MKKKLKLTAIISAFLLGVIYIGCDDAGNSPTTTGLYPDINMKAGSVYVYTNDSLPYSGTPRRTRYQTTNTFVDSGTYYGQAGAFKIRTVTRDTVTQFQLSSDSFFVSYDKTAGKFYQYGLTHYIDSSRHEWTVVADFSVTQGNEYPITNFNTTLYGIPVNVVITGKIAENTTFQTTWTPSQTISCYRVEIKSVVTPTGLPSSTIYLDYYLGYDVQSASNPPGPVRLKLRPFTLFTLQYAGFDQILKTFVIP